MQEIVTTMDPATSYWSVVFKVAVGKVPRVLKRHRLFIVFPSWSFYLFSKVMAHSQIITTYALISSWSRPLSQGGETSSITCLACAILAFFSCPWIPVCSVMKRCASHRDMYVYVARQETQKTIFETEHKCHLPHMPLNVSGL